MNIDTLKGKTVGAAVSGGLDKLHPSPNGWSITGSRSSVFTADLGQPDERDVSEIRERMLACGAEDAIIVDAKDALAEAGPPTRPVSSDV